MKKQKLMLLGGNRYQIPIIKKAHELGLYVITCDYLPDNIAHKYSDEYINISIIDKDKVLEAAKEHSIDGIMSFACDPGVVTAAYVAELMGLPFQGSYKSTSILQDKGLFRDFLAKNGFNVPHAKSYNDISSPYKDIDWFSWPVIVKPTDSAGSKGVSKVETPEDLEKGIDLAVSESRVGSFIIEDFLTFKGYHSSADVFTVDGEIKFITFSDQLFDNEAENPYTPSLIIWPSTMTKEDQKYLTEEIQRLMKLLDMKTGIYNIETCVGINGKPYIMEVSPRGGGCKIAEIQEMAMGVPLIENEIRSSVGMPLIEMNETIIDGIWCETIIHANPGQQGVLSDLLIENNIKERYLKVLDLSAQPGDYIYPFTGANMSLGDMFLKFESREELERVLSEIHSWIHIILNKEENK